MTGYHLIRVKIEGFRGINNDGHPLDLRFASDKVNSVYAGNGLGKSSVYDAVSYAIFGRIPKLDSLEQAENAASYINNRFHPTGLATIELTFSADDGSGKTVITIRRAQDGSRNVTSADTADPEAFLEALRSDFILLDQDTFTKFFRDRSLERGRTFARLLGLSRLSSFRLALQKLCNAGTLASDLGLDNLRSTIWTLKSQRNALVDGLNTSFEQITGRRFAGAFQPSTFSAAILDSLRQVTTIRPFCEVASLLDIQFADVEHALSLAESSTDRQNLVKCQEALQRLQSLSKQVDEDAEQASLTDAIRDRDDKLAQTAGPLLLTNYQAASAVFGTKEWPDSNQCPTCGIRHDTSVQDAIASKLATYESYQAAVKAIKVHWETSCWAKRWQELEHCRDLGNGRNIPQLDALVPCFSQGVVSAAQLQLAVQALEQLETERLRAITALSAAIDDLEKRLPPSMVAVTRQVATAKKAATDLREYESLLPKLESATSRASQVDAWAEFITKAHRDFADAEAQWIKSRQRQIAVDYQAMHDFITKNPEVVPDLDRADGTERHQLRLSQFYGLNDLSANTLLQESYCNAAAISIFLSAALACPSVARFVILDDVTSSFDGGHQFYLMELLRTKVASSAAGGGLQVILLTHDTLLEKYLDKATQTLTWNHQKLIGRPPVGPVLTEQHNADRIRQRAVDLLNTGQVVDGAPWIRQYLECILSRVIRKVAIRVPVDYAVDDNKKMVQNSLSAIQREIDLHHGAGKLIMDAAQVNQAAQTLVPSLLANFCAHFQTGASAGVSPHVLIAVLNDVDALADCFKYDCTCQIPGTTTRRFYRDLGNKACNC